MHILILILLLVTFSCEDTLRENNEKTNLLFVASEGNFGNSDGAIYVFDGDENIQVIEDIGDVVQSLLVHNDKLYVAVNNSHLIKIFQITESGLSLPGIEIPTDNSSPREMCIVNNKLYFTNWNTKNLKVLNLYTYSIESSISLDGVPEDIVSDKTHLWVSIPNIELYDKNEGSSVVKINITTGEVVENYEVGSGPNHMILDNDLLWISRTFYNSYWEAYYGSSVLNIQTGEISIIDYGAGTVCGGNLVKLNNQIYRTANGGVVKLDTDLSLNFSSRIGNYGSVYSSGSDNQSLFLGVSDYIAPDTVYVHDEVGDQIGALSVGVLPGDFAVWEN